MGMGWPWCLPASATSATDTPWLPDHFVASAAAALMRFPSSALRPSRRARIRLTGVNRARALAGLAMAGQ